MSNARHIELIPIIACFASIGVFLTIRFAVFALLKRSRDQSEGRMIAIRVSRLPSIFWCIIAGLRVGEEFWRVDEHFLKLASLVITILTVVSFTMVASRTLKEIVAHYLSRIKSPLAHNGLIRGVITGISFLLGGLILLSQLGIRIEAFLTALGVGGLAISLALQDTMSNAFAGIGLLLDRSVDLGDTIRLENGMEGTVLDIGWRTTRLKTNTNDLMVIPNTKLAQSIAVRKDTLKPKPAPTATR